MFFSINDSPMIYNKNKPEKIIEISSEENQMLYWIYLDNKIEMLIYTDGLHYETFILTNQENNHTVKMPKNCYLMLEHTIEQKLMDNFDETKSNSLYWYNYLSDVLQNADTYYTD